MNTNNAVHAMARVRALATRHAAEELEHCLAQAIVHGDNACINDGAIEERINALARAGFVKQQVEQGATLTNALRELGRRMRAIYKSPHPQGDK